MRTLSIISGFVIGLLVLGATIGIIAGMIFLVGLAKGAGSGLLIVGAIIAALAGALARSGAVQVGSAIPDILDHASRFAELRGLDGLYFNTTLTWTFVLGFCGSGVGFFVYMNTHYQF